MMMMMFKIQKTIGKQTIVKREGDHKTKFRDDDFAFTAYSKMSKLFALVYRLKFHLELFMT